MKRTVGDTRSAFSARLLTDAGDPIDCAALTVKFLMEDSSGTAVVAATASSVTIQPTVTFTASATTDRLSANGHGLKAGWQIIVANSGGSLPTGLSASTRYFVRDVAPNSFKVATEPDGAVVDITGAGTGTNTFYVVGHVQYDFQSADVDTAGIYYVWFQIVASAEIDHFPSNGRSEVNLLEIVEAA